MKKIKTKVLNLIKIRLAYVHAKEENERIVLRELYPKLCNDKMGMTTVFSKSLFFGDQLIIENNGKKFCRLTLAFDLQKKNTFKIGINDDGSGLRFKLVNGKDKNKAEQYLIPIYPKINKIKKQ